MLYRKRPMTYKQHIHAGAKLNLGEDTNSNSITNAEEIPLPNERESEDALDNRGFKKKPKKPWFLNIFNSRIHMDEIILLGLIFLLFDEGIEDDLLLILLVYILLAGRE